MYWTVRIFFAAALLAANSIRDLRQREILLLPTVLSGFTGAVLYLAAGGAFMGLLAALLPGSILLCCGLISEQAGAGDGILVMALGIWTGAPVIYPAVPAAFALLVLTAGDFRIFRRKVRDWPFVPFLAAGTAAVCLIGRLYE